MGKLIMGAVILCAALLAAVFEVARETNNDHRFRSHHESN